MRNKHKHNIILPRGTAKWLLNNTNLSAEQICRFCNNMSFLDLELIKNRNLSVFNPIDISLSWSIIKECEKTPTAFLQSLRDFNKLQPKYLRRASMSAQHKKRKINYLTWFFENRKENRICVNKTISILRIRYPTLIKQLKNTETVEAINPLEDKICSSNDIKKIFTKCSCDNYCENFNLLLDQNKNQA